MYLGAKIGATISILAFALFGLVPALVYGGYIGLLMTTTLAITGIFSQAIVIGGMCLGFVSTLFLFTIFGAVSGAIVGYVVNWLIR